MSDAHVSLIYMVAGEASGDILGARLMQALSERAQGAVRFRGVGGPRMRALGLQSLFDESELAHVGIAEIIRHVPALLRRMEQVAQDVQSTGPAALITIDAPDFCFRVAKKLKQRGSTVPRIHYVAPSVWAWRAGRAQTIAGFLDHLMALLPFEPPYFTRYGLPCSFVGHPLVESAAAAGDGAGFRARRGLSASAPLLAVLPGSRGSEIGRLMPVFRQTVERLAPLIPGLHVVIPLAPAVADRVRAACTDWHVPVLFTTEDGDKYDALAAARAALACSGTVSIELALARLPSVIAYRVHALTAFLARRLLRTRYVTLINIMQDRAVMPEYLQERCRPDLLADAVVPLMTDDAAHAEQKDMLAAIAGWLGAGAFVPSERAADVVLGVIEKHQKQSQTGAR